MFFRSHSNNLFKVEDFRQKQSRILFFCECISKKKKMFSKQVNVDLQLMWINYVKNFILFLYLLLINR